MEMVPNSNFAHRARSSQVNVAVDYSQPKKTPQPRCTPFIGFLGTGSGFADRGFRRS